MSRRSLIVRLAVPVLVLAAGLSFLVWRYSQPQLYLPALTASDPSSLANDFARAFAENGNRELWPFSPRWRIAEVSEIASAGPPPNLVLVPEREYRVVLTRGGGADRSRAETDVIFVGVSPRQQRGGWKVNSWGGAP